MEHHLGSTSSSRCSNVGLFFVSAGVQILKGRSENLSGQASNGEAALAAVSVGIELCCFCLEPRTQQWIVHNPGSGSWKR